MTKGQLSKEIDTINYPIEAPRDYIGASSIGSPCMRQLWYEFKQFPKEEASNKTKRTWEIGKRLEALVILWVQLAGKNVSLRSYYFLDEEFPYFQGHLDGLILNYEGEPVEILEIKTAKDASFNQFVKNGLKKWQPKYYDQIQ